GVSSCVFFFQAEDGIRDWSVTGVQTCALPILRGRRRPDWSYGVTKLGARILTLAALAGRGRRRSFNALGRTALAAVAADSILTQIGRASWRGRVESSGGGRE